ncbi:MAG: glycosyltransferase family 4 protein [Verrucomicrobia bacterium]|nr:glycosyltransferase family 4 protein [Verrucomicrobiota bacterium]
MHLLVVTTRSDRSETAVYGALVARGHTVTVLCQPDTPEAATLAASGVNVIPNRIRHRLDLTAVYTMRRICRRLNPDVIYAPRNDSLSITLLATSGKHPAIVGYRGTIGHISRWDPAAWLTYLHPRVARILCVSEAVRTYLLEFNLPKNRLVTIHKGHDVAWYDAMPKPTRADLGLPADAFLVGFTGRMRPVKGGDVLLRAIANIPPERKVHLVMVGAIDDPLVQQLAASPPLRDRIHRLGHRTDAAAIATLFDAFAMPSIEREGLPRAVIEAMSQRVAPIVTSVGGMPELVVNGVSGLIIPPRDAGALAAAIESLASDPIHCRQLGNAARTRIESHFNIRHTIAKMESLFLHAMHAPPPEERPRTPA